MKSLCIIGHNEHSIKVRATEFSLPFGEINNARKLYNVLQSRNIPCTEILDLYDLFGIESIDSESWDLVRDMVKTNSILASGNQELITDFNTVPAKSFHRHLKMRLSEGEYVLLLLTWPLEGLSIISTGIHRDYPTIVKEDSYIRGNYQARLFPLKQFAEEADLLISESLLGALNSRDYGVPSGKFCYLPNLAPPEAKELHQLPLQEHRQFRERYLQSVAAKNGKDIHLNEETLVIGCPARCVRRKNVDMLIHALYQLSKEFSNILFVLKGPLDSEFDDLTLYSEKLHQLIKSVDETPWFFWDKDPTPYPEVLRVYKSFDVCSLPSGAEIGCNTVVEVCAMGVPCVLLEATVNPYLYRGMALFVKAGDLTISPWVYSQPILEDLIQTLRELLQSPEKRKELGLKARELAQKRFGEHQLVKRVPLMTEAAWHFHHKTSEAKDYQERLEHLLQKDLEEYGIR